MSQSTISNPYDKLFCGSMQDPEVARDFLMAHLPDELIKKIDSKSMAVCPNTLIDEELLLTGQSQGNRL